MLCSINSGKYVKTLPHKKNYDKWHKHLSDEDYAKIIDELGKRIDSQEINTAGWIPGMIGREQYLSQYIMRVVEMNVKQGCFLD